MFVSLIFYYISLCTKENIQKIGKLTFAIKLVRYETDLIMVKSIVLKLYDQTKHIRLNIALLFSFLVLKVLY